MKRLLIALAAAAAVSTASALVTHTQLFEESTWSGDDDFIVDQDDESALVQHETNPDIAAPYPCTGFGEKYLSLDTGDTPLWYTNRNSAVGNIYFDMALQFNPCATAPELDPDDSTKILLYQNASSNLVILAGETVGGSDTNYVTTTKVAPGTWARVTVSSSLGNDGYTFTVRLNDTVLKTTDNVESFPSRKTDRTIAKVGFSGSGALDNFVARTTDPYYSGRYVARIDEVGGNITDFEKYSTYSEALADALAAADQSASVTITHSDDTTSDGTESNPYEIRDAAGLIALQNAVLVNPAVRSLHYAQTANIDMASAGAFAGIGEYNVNPGSGTPFTGVYDGRGYKIYNVTLTDHNYAGIFNMVDGVNTVGCGVVKNLTVEDVSYVGTASTYCASIVGYALRGATLQNLTSAGTFGSQSKPGTHNMAGIVIRVSGGTEGDGTQILYCTNNATIYGSYTKLAGICAISQEKGDTSNKMVFTGCANNGDLVLNRSSNGVTGFAGIVGYSDVNTVMTDCSHAGTLANQGSGYNTDCNGALVGQTYGHTITDGGSNSAPANEKMVGLYKSGGATVTGFQYATVDNGMATTVTTLAKDTTYLLEGDVAASETPVYTFNEAGTIAFDTALGYTFAGTVTTDNGMLDVTDGTAGTVTTYTATEGTVVATITKSGNTTSYNTLQKALTAAESGDEVNLVENAAISGEVNIPADVTVVLASGVSLGNVTALSGTGVLFVPSGTVVPLVQTGHAASLLRDAEKWAGTLSIKDATMSGPDGLAYYGNANSTVRFENVWLKNYSSSHAIGTLELVGAGVYIQVTSGNMTLPCALVGDGSISLRDASDTQRTVLFSGDVSAFAGNVTVATDTKSRIVFGTNASTQGNNNCIVVDSGASVTVAEGKTWTAPNGYVIKGTATVSGTLAAGSEKVYGAGCVIYTSATAAAASAPIAGSWTGTYVVGWAPTGAFNPNTYGNANSTVVLSNDLAASAYFGPGSATTLTINPTVRIATDVEIKNGYSKADDSCLVTFTKLTGDHKFSTSPGTGGTDANPTTRRYAITTLDSFTGSLKVKAGSELRIATVNVADGTNLSGLIIPAECDAKSTVEGAHADGVITGALALTVAGVDSGKTLTYDANGAEGAGLYVVAPSGFDGGDGATFNIPDATQSALAAVLPSGKTLADVADAASGMTYAQAYALGLLNETTGDVEDLKATIEVVGGKVKVSLDATAGTAYTVTLKVYEKASLSAEWPDTPKATYTLGSAEESTGFTPGSGSAPAGFYKVGVSVSNK